MFLANCVGGAGGGEKLRGGSRSGELKRSVFVGSSLEGVGARELLLGHNSRLALLAYRRQSGDGSGDETWCLPSNELAGVQ